MNRDGLRYIYPIPGQRQAGNCSIEATEGGFQQCRGLGLTDQIAKQCLSLAPEYMHRKELRLVERGVESQVVVDYQQPAFGRAPKQVRIAAMRRQRTIGVFHPPVEGQQLTPLLGIDVLELRNSELLYVRLLPRAKS